MPSGIAARARRKTARVLIEILPSQDLPQRFCITLSGFQYRSLQDVPLARARALARELRTEFKKLGEPARLLDHSAVRRDRA